MKELTIALCAILFPVAFSSTTDKPAGGNSPGLAACSVNSLHPPSQFHLRADPRLIADDSLRDQGLVESYNWSGYAATADPATADTVKSVSGSWTVTAATGSSGQYCATWVGIDGFDDGTVEQLGTMQYITTGGNGRNAKTEAGYYAWVEMYPAGLVELSTTKYPVAPGDTISATVSCSADVFTLTMSSSEGWNYSETVTSATPDRMSAEWVVEAPSSDFGILPLADFGTITFTDCSATIGNTSGTISALPTYDSMTMVEDDRQLTPEATPSSLSDSGADFSVTWKAAGR